MPSDQVKGHLDLMLLRVLQDGPAHGYAVITALRERSGGSFDLPEGTVYPALHRLEEGDLLTSEWQAVGGRRRRIYQVTRQGMAALATERSRWSTFVSAVESVLAPMSPVTA